MTLNNYTPTGSEVLFEEVRAEKTASGIYIPDANFVLTDQKDFWELEKVVYDGSKSKLGKYKVVKANVTFMPGDTIILRKGVTPEEIELDERTYFQINGAYIIGYCRE